MNQLISLRLLPVLIGILSVCYGCSVSKKTTAVVREKILIGEYNTDWLRYKVYLLPGDSSRKAGHGKKDNLVLSIMVINMQDNTSPLRKLSTNLDDYNRYYEYLLNSCKNDITIQAGRKQLYPVYYSFENNYDAFPFETINVGFEYDLQREGMKGLQLIYADKIFSRNTITCNLNSPN